MLSQWATTTVPVLLLGKRNKIENKLSDIPPPFSQSEEFAHHVIVGLKMSEHYPNKSFACMFLCAAVSSLQGPFGSQNSNFPACMSYRLFT